LILPHLREKKPSSSKHRRRDYDTFLIFGSNCRAQTKSAQVPQRIGPQARPQS
jgi:hypothetical protein